MNHTISPDQTVLFAEPAARRTDPETSHEAALSVEAWVQDDALLKKFAIYGPLTDEQLELCSPGWYGPTARSARSRLTKRGLLVADGVEKNSRNRNMTRWRLA